MSTSAEPSVDTSRTTTAGWPVAVSTTLEIPGKKIIGYKGSCFGVVVRSMGFAKSWTANIKSLAGGEITQYTQLLEDTRRHALDRMIRNAQALGANAVVSMRFDSSEIGGNLAEVVAYGTAVQIADSQQG